MNYQIYFPIPGSSYIFGVRFGVWTQIQRLVAGDGETSDYYGARVSIHGGLVVIAARQDDDVALNAGKSIAVLVLIYD